jgi:putative flavoprotein involved in K+ transport
VSARHEVVVVGGGQAGLAIGYFLARQGRDFVIFEAADAPAAAWRARWDSLRLFTPVRYDSLPGYAFPGDPDSYPARDDVVAYLTDYVERFKLPVEPDNRVNTVRPVARGYMVELEGRSHEADQVVIATGPFQVPRVPAIAARLGADVTQFHSTEYRTPRDVPDGRVLVVGGGNTGFQIAQELSVTHEVHLSIGSRQTPLPQRILGRDLFWYLDRTGLIYKTTTSRIGRRAAGRDTLIGSTPRVLRRRHGVRLQKRAVDARASTVTFSDRTSEDFSTVIWATGFQVDHSWVHAPVFDDQGGSSSTRRHQRARALFPGPHLAAHQGSALLGWVKDDAEYIANQIGAFRPAEPRTLERVGRIPTA